MTEQEPRRMIPQEPSSVEVNDRHGFATGGAVTYNLVLEEQVAVEIRGDWDEAVDGQEMASEGTEYCYYDDAFRILYFPKYNYTASLPDDLSVVSVDTGASCEATSIYLKRIVMTLRNEHIVGLKTKNGFPEQIEKIGTIDSAMHKQISGEIGRECHRYIKERLERDAYVAFRRFRAIGNMIISRDAILLSQCKEPQEQAPKWTLSDQWLMVDASMAENANRSRKIAWKEARPYNASEQHVVVRWDVSRSINSFERLLRILDELGHINVILELYSTELVGDDITKKWAVYFQEVAISIASGKRSVNIFYGLLRALSTPCKKGMSCAHCPARCPTVQSSVFYFCPSYVNPSGAIGDTERGVNLGSAAAIEEDQQRQFEKCERCSIKSICSKICPSSNYESAFNLSPALCKLRIELAKIAMVLHSIRRRESLSNSK